MKKTTIIMVIPIALFMFNLHASVSIKKSKTILNNSKTCITPFNLTKNSINKSNTLVVRWDKISSSSIGFELLIVSKDKLPIISNSVYNGFTRTNSISIPNLKMKKGYDVYVRSICDEINEVVSNWSERMSFQIDDFPSEDKITSLQDTAFNDSLEELKIFPNPAISKFRIQGIDVDVIELYNILGSKVIEARNTNIVNISNLKKGAYLVKISVKDKSVIKKLIIAQ